MSKNKNNKNVAKQSTAKQSTANNTATANKVANKVAANKASAKTATTNGSNSSNSSNGNTTKTTKATATDNTTATATRPAITRRKFTMDDKRKYVAKINGMIDKGTPVTKACEKAGIGDKVFRDWRRALDAFGTDSGDTASNASNVFANLVPANTPTPAQHTPVFNTPYMPTNLHTEIAIPSDLQNSLRSRYGSWAEFRIEIITPLGKLYLS